jgi:hypothetical protein
MMFTIIICSSFSEWNSLLLQPLEELHTILHVVSCLLAEYANIMQDLPLLRGFIARLEGRTFISTCTNSS